MGHILVKSDYNPRQYESRSLLTEAINNRAEGIMKEWQVSSIYNGPERAAVEVMHKHQATHNEIAWVLAGDNITKSYEVYAYIDSILKQPIGQTVGGKGTYGFKDGKAQMHGADKLLGLGENVDWGTAGMGGKAKGPQSASVQDTHPTPQEQQQQGGYSAATGQVAKPGLWNRMKTWATDRAAPAAARGLRHLGATAAGGLVGGPLGAAAGLAGSMAQAHRGKQTGQYGKVMGGEGGLNQIAADAGAQAGQAAKDFAGQQAQNFQTGEGAMGTVGQAAGAAKNLGQSAWQGIKNIGGAIAQPFQDAWQQAGVTQDANAAAQPPAHNIPGVGGNPNPNVQGPPGPANTPTTPFPGNAQADPTQAQTVVDQGQGQQQQEEAQLASQTTQPWGTNPMHGQADATSMFATSSDDPSSAYSSIESILKGL